MITGIILAGGKSTRMGTDKGLVPFMGAPMISRVIRNLRPLCEEIIISANSEAYDEFGCTVLRDEIPDRGPAGGILTCLKNSAIPVCLVISADMPLASTSFLKEIIRRSGENNLTICKEDDMVQPLCGIYKRNIIPELEKFILGGNLKLREFVRSFGAQTIEQEQIHGFPFQFYLSNINTPEELRSQEQVRAFILTGPKNAGKSRYLREMIDYFRLTRMGFSGIVTKPVIEKNIKTGHYLEELENGREHLLCTVSPEPGWISSGRFYFNPETLKFGNDLLASFTNRQLPTADCQLPTANRQLIIIDELGPLELKCSGWWPGIASLLKSSIQKLIIVVREEIMVEAWNLLKDHHVHIININDSLSPEEIARRVLWEPV